MAKKRGRVPDKEVVSTSIKTEEVATTMPLTITHTKIVETASKIVEPVEVVEEEIKPLIQLKNISGSLITVTYKVNGSYSTYNLSPNAVISLSNEGEIEQLNNYIKRNILKRI